MRKGDFKALEASTSCPVLQDSDVGNYCGNCLSALKGAREVLELACASQLSTSESQRRATLGCPKGSVCREVFCSATCLNQALVGPTTVGWHALVCENDLVEFYDYCRRSNESFSISGKVMARLASAALHGQASHDVTSIFFQKFCACHSCSEISARSLLKKHADYQEFIQRVRVSNDQLADAWKLLAPHFQKIVKEHPTCSELTKVLNFDTYAGIVAFAQSFMVALSDGRVMKKQKFGSSDGKWSSASWRTLVQKKFAFPEEISITASRIKHDQDCELQTAVYSGLLMSHELTDWQHSCVPNVQLGVSSTAPNRYGYFALRDIEEGEPMRYAAIPLIPDVSARALLLLRKTGKVCGCLRCSWEKQEFHCLSLTQLKQLALQAQEEGRYADAEILLHFVVTRQPHDGEALHSYGVTLLHQGKWKLAHEVWRVAFTLNRQHIYLSKQAAKDRSYVSDTSIATYHLSFRTVAVDEIYLTTSGALSAVCSEWITAAENIAQKRRGWSTDRHKSVATTDLPIHEIPSILAQWNNVFCQVISPFIKERFRISNAHGNLFVHDAFVVKYDANNGQSELPIHTDQGQFSLTISLNSPNEYSGGGTIFPERELFVRPKCGDFVAFRSSLAHGGLNITSGIRYIIVAFLYIS